MRIAVIHQGCIPTYREPFYRRLGAGYTIYHGQSMEGIATAKPPYFFDNQWVENKRWGRMIWQPVFWPVVKGGYDAIVIGHESKYLANIALAIWFRLRRRPVILWGFGRNVKGPRLLQYLLLCLCTDYLAYTVGGASQVPLPLDRVIALGNTIDLEPEIKAHAEACLHNRDALRAEMSLKPEDIVFLYVGRNLPEKKIDDLIYATRRLRQEGLPVEARIVTDVYDRERLAKIFRAADAMVIPGYVGLAVVHSFAHGLPVITGKSAMHSPEVEYIQDGANGLICEDLIGGLREFATSPVLRQGLARGALLTRDKLSLDSMVDAFRRGVTQAVSRPKLRRDLLHFMLDLIVGVPVIVALAAFFAASRMIRGK